MDELELPVENAIKFLTSRELSPSDFEIGLTSEEQLIQWSDEQAELSKTYADRRKAEYPPATDYLDGIVKGDQAQIDKYIADCLAIKEKFPKE